MTDQHATAEQWIKGETIQSVWQGQNEHESFWSVGQGDVAAIDRIMMDGPHCHIAAVRIRHRNGAETVIPWHAISGYRTEGTKP